MSTIDLLNVRFDIVHHEESMKESVYLKAGSPATCQNPACKRVFDGSCVRGDDDRFYCSEVCAQVGFGTVRKKKPA